MNDRRCRAIRIAAFLTLTFTAMSSSPLFSVWRFRATSWVQIDQAAAKVRDPDDMQEEAMKWFMQQAVGGQMKVIDATRKNLADSTDPLLASINAFAARANAEKPHEFQTQVKASPEGSFPLAAELPFPIHKEYIFGARILRPVDHATKSRATATPPDDMRAMLDGYPPDLDLALAQIISDLDNDKSADEFAMFLESWRNNDESFYRALDRTAGTPGEVFYYDAMLGQFNAKFLKGEDFTKKKPPVKTLKQAHDALHGGFLTYRQYRALREAAALSLLLPPGAKLPKNLARYQQKPEGQYSMRDQLQIFLAASKYDFGPVIELIKSVTPKMPESIWDAKYEPLPPLGELFTKKTTEYSDDKSLGSPEVILKKCRDARGALAKAVAAAAQKALTAAGCSTYKDAHH